MTIRIIAYKHLVGSATANAKLSVQLGTGMATTAVVGDEELQIRSTFDHEGMVFWIIQQQDVTEDI